MHVPIFPFLERNCSGEDEVSLGSGFCHLTEFSVVASVVHHSMECEKQSMLNFSFSSKCCCACLYAHLSPNLHPPDSGTSFVEVCTKQSFRFP